MITIYCSDPKKGQVKAGEIVDGVFGKLVEKKH